ncbi:MAG: 50S ribosomal protein L29 [Micavibrio sp.]|nr:50S ribosomal protein L29 [Micavibrio sp.]HCK31992.1 50S ribosomal protein L29 [Rhodospirillaceae bacterium]|tara:strand:- start:264 stop:557 length:294 start_codon:yes stop_codon:yes gene_type:complete
MKAEELRTKSQDELKKFVLDGRKEQFNMRFQKANGQLENTAQLRTLRRDIARAKTVATELEKGIVAKAPKAEKKAPAKKAAPKKAAAKKTTTKKADK